MANNITKKYLVTADGHKKIDAVIKELYGEDIPRSKLRALFDNKCVLLNGRNCLNPGTAVYPGNQIELKFEAEKKYKEKGKAPPTRGFKVVYEDGHVIVVDKEAGLLTVPTLMGDPDTLIDRLRYFVPRGIEPHVVHRLDRDTSGLLVFAKSKGAGMRIKEQFQKRKPERVYHAFVKGELETLAGTFQSFLAMDEDLNQYSVEDETLGKLAITHYQVHRTLVDATWVKVKLETGRRNQIRVHFSEKKHPVIGDTRYERKHAKHPDWVESGLALHATSLGFYHPYAKKVLHFESPLPYRMEKFLAENAKRSKLEKKTN